MPRFIDTSALYAILDRDHAFHAAAAGLWTKALGESEQLVTSNYVALESFALVQHRLGMPALRTLHDDLLPVIRMQWVTLEEHAAAAQMVLASDRKSLSLVACSSFGIMRRLGLRSVVTFDRHFKEQGFIMLPA